MKNQLVILIAFLLTLATYNYLPEKIVTHFSENSVSYSNKINIFVIPILMLVMYLLFEILPKIDPLRYNYKKFRKYYNEFVFYILLILLIVQVFLIAYNLGMKIKTNYIISAIITALFLELSRVLKNTKQNWFFGIKTPWTLSSEKVWEKTHKIGSKIFFYLAILNIISFFYSKFTKIIIFLSIIASGYLIYYSYKEYKKENQ